MSRPDPVTETFETHRPRLTRLAYRMLGSLAEAEDAVRDMLSGNAFGDAGARVVIEEFLDGEEASFIVMVDGEHVLLLEQQPYPRSWNAGRRHPQVLGWFEVEVREDKAGHATALTDRPPTLQ